jgi:Beta propeller domain
MKRELLSPLAIALGAMIAVTACSSDSVDVSSTSTDEIDGPATTTATPTTLPGDSTPDTLPDTDPGTEPDSGPLGFASAQLEFFGDCPAVLDYMRTEAAERVTAWGLGGGGYYYGEGDVLRAPAAADSEASTAGAAPSTGAPAPELSPVEAPGFSETNTQEVGVDEGDIVETDGEFIYVANQDGLRIVRVSDADVVAEPELPEGSHQLLLSGDRLLVVTSSYTGSADTIVSLFDVSEATAPSLLRRSHLEGSILATRSVDGVARLVISTSFDQRLPFVQPSQFGLDEDRALERNQQIIDESAIEDWLPRWFDEAGDGSFAAMQPILDCNTVAAPEEFAGLGLTWIASVDMLGEATPTGSAGIVSTGNTVYASTDNLYIATQNWDWQFLTPIPIDATAVDDSSTSEPASNDNDVAVDVAVDPGPPPTFIHQFGLGEGISATYVASGSVPGRLLNQFAMSEHNGDLRVATTTDDWNVGGQSESAVYVLRPNGESLDVISSVGGLGKTEQIYAVRFLGDLAYVVTFRQTDPLYVIDLTDPAAPVLQGELKIPGYSAYLHPVGDGLLLGVGQSADDSGRTQGTQLSLFDVSDPTNPQQISTLAIGGSSEAEWDHKAFLFWPEDGTIVLPVSPDWSSCPLDVACLAEDIKNASGGAIVAQLDGRELSARGTITHEDRNDSGCWNPLQRSIVIGTEIATIGLDQVKFSDRLTLAPRDSASWGDPEQYGCYWYAE